MDLLKINQELADKSPVEIASWALSIAKKPLVSTNFRPLEASILHAVYEASQGVPVVWIDSGYNTSFTYQHALEIIDQLELKIDTFVPKQSVAFRNVTLGIPEPDTKEHAEFTEQVKLEPFKRAMDKYQPDVWFANLRKGQTAFRDNLDIVNLTKEGVLKICPFYHWSDEQVEAYLKSNNLSSEDRYYDPTKVHANRECGLHT
ncbi:MAG: phosphoadenosine phosphosulfate reductase family protein [Crocinitomicaceae bacterium]